MFFRIDVGSMSTWMILAVGQNSETFPVTRSSNRAPTAITQIRIVHGHVGHVSTVHAEHPQRQGMLSRKRPQRPSRFDPRESASFQPIRGPQGRPWTTARRRQGIRSATRLHDGVSRLFNFPFAAFIGRIISANGHGVGKTSRRSCSSKYLWNVHQHGARPARWRRYKTLL